MIRLVKLNEYGKSAVDSVNYLFKECGKNQIFKSDILLCEQNGFFFDNHPTIGPGDEGFNSVQGFNQAFGKGIGNTTDDDKYFEKLDYRNFNGITSYEQYLHEELSKYKNIWENNFILRTLIQLAHLINGEHYDWNLNVFELIQRKRSKCNIIEQDIIKRFKCFPPIYNILRIAYNNKIRNGEAHSQYHVVNGGIVLVDHTNHSDSILPGITFEQWEQIYIFTYCFIRYIWYGLKMLSQTEAAHCIQNNSGIPIYIPCDNDKWQPTMTYPVVWKEDNTENIRWVFKKTY